MQEQEVTEEFFNLISSHTQLHKDDSWPSCFQSSAGYSLKKMQDTSPVAHNLKMWLKYVAFDLLLRLIPSGPMQRGFTATRDAFKLRLLVAAKPYVNQENPKFLDELANRWYTKSSIGLFRNDVNKFDHLPRSGRALATLATVVADQYITSCVDKFNIATFAWSTFLQEDVARLLEPDMFEASADLGKHAESHDMLATKTLWLHSQKHTVQQVECVRRNSSSTCSTDLILEGLPIALHLANEGILDHALGQFKPLSERTSGQESADTEMLFLMWLSIKKAKAGSGLTSPVQTMTYDTDYVRKPMVFLPCFTLKPELSPIIAALLTRSSQRVYSHLIHKHPNMPDAVLILKEDQEITHVSQSSSSHSGKLSSAFFHRDWSVLCLCDDKIPKCVFMD